MCRSPPFPSIAVLPLRELLARLLCFQAPLPVDCVWIQLVYCIEMFLAALLGSLWRCAGQWHLPFYEIWSHNVDLLSHILLWNNCCLLLKLFFKNIILGWVFADKGSLVYLYLAYVGGYRICLKKIASMRSSSIIQNLTLSFNRMF